jgi:hypothetical protein
VKGRCSEFSLKYDHLLGLEKEIIPINSRELSKEHKDSIDCSNIVPNEIPIINEEHLVVEEFTDESDVHYNMRPMLFRHFVEAIVRASFVYYQDSDASLKDKSEWFLKEKLAPRLDEVISKESSHEPSLSFKHNKALESVKKELFELFKFHSLDTNDKFFDYTISVSGFIEMAAKVLDELKMKKIDLVGLIERDYDTECTADAILENADLTEEEKNEQYEVHVKSLLNKELIYYEFKELILELAYYYTKDLTEDKLKEFLKHWIRINSSKEIRKQIKPKRKWIPTDKELM